MCWTHHGQLHLATDEYKASVKPRLSAVVAGLDKQSSNEAIPIFGTEWSTPCGSDKPCLIAWARQSEEVSVCWPIIYSALILATCLATEITVHTR